MSRQAPGPRPICPMPHAPPDRTTGPQALALAGPKQPLACGAREPLALKGRLADGWRGSPSNLIHQSTLSPICCFGIPHSQRSPNGRLDSLDIPLDTLDTLSTESKPRAVNGQPGTASPCCREPGSFAPFASSAAAIIDLLSTDCLLCPTVDPIRPQHPAAPVTATSRIQA